VTDLPAPRISDLARAQTPQGTAADYLSGLLIGAEVAAQADANHRPVVLIGAEALSRRYAAALAQGGFRDVQIADGAAATARGLWRIHEAAHQ